MSILESLNVNLNTMTATTKNGVNIKGVRKVIQDYLKEQTSIKGYWTVWFDYDDGEKYHFTITNPVRDLYGTIKSN
jgi:non-homologous end joining protein Ku